MYSIAFSALILKSKHFFYIFAVRKNVFFPSIVNFASFLQSECDKLRSVLELKAESVVESAAHEHAQASSQPSADGVDSVVMVAANHNSSDGGGAPDLQSPRVCCYLFVRKFLKVYFL